MMENYLIFTIPFVLIQTVCGQTPDEPGIKFNVKNPVEYKIGDGIDVICSLTDNTPSASDAKMQWFDKTGAEIPSNAGTRPYVISIPGGQMLMTLGDATEDMAGKYKCRAKVNEVVYEESLDIQISKALTFEMCDLEQSGLLNTESEITCTVTDSNFVTYWGRDNPPMADDTDKYLPDSTKLRIFNTELEDEGTYKYTAVSLTTALSETREIKFKVLIPPTIVEPLQSSTAVVGRSATLYCNAKGKPDPIIEWKKEGSTNILETTDRITVEYKKIENAEGSYVQGILNFTSVIKEDEANYICYAKNEASIDGLAEESENKALLEVNIPPTFEKVTEGKGIEGGPAILSCIVRGDPVPDMLWVNVKTGDSYKPGSTVNGITTTKQVLDKDNNLGANITMSFSSLKHSDAGQYKCWAKNDAAEAEKIVNLEVEYKPNFNDQATTLFYNWLGNKDSYITCTANGNPLPGFMWYKGDREITAGDNFHKIERSETDPENPHRAISKLLVTFNGNNGEAVFGDYKCEAINLRGRSEIALSMEQAERPGKPMVDAKKEDARHIEFWLYEPTVKGPEVTRFKVVYKVQGGTEEAKTQEVEKEYRDHGDISRKYTVLPVNDLLPSTVYVFTFYAINPVGEGSGREMVKTTKPISVPDAPEITTQANSPYSTRILVQWRVPSDGGSEILEYRLTHQRVIVQNKTYDGTKGYEVLNKIKPLTTIDKIKDPSRTITTLDPGKHYEIKVYARNSEGYSLPSEKVIRTQNGQTGGLSTGAIIGIVIGIFFLLFIVVDVTCYFKNNCGILMSIKEKVGGGREEGYAVAKTEDVENLAKKDELTEEVKAAEEGELAETQEDEKKEPLLPEEQNVDTVDEGKPEKPELEPEDKEASKTEQKIDSPKTEQVPSEPAHEDIPAADEQQE